MEGEHREARVTVVCIGREEVYHKCKFRCTNGSNGNDNRNNRSKFNRYGRAATSVVGSTTEGDTVDLEAGNVEPRG